jgi:hypothetical protein
MWCGIGAALVKMQDESASRDAVSTKIKQSVYTTHLVAGRLGGVQHWPFVPPTCSFLPSSSGEVRVCHTRAPMQHEEKQSNGVFSHPHTSYGIAHQIRQSIVLVMSNPSSSTPVSSTRNGFGGGEANRSSAHQACLILRPPEPVFLIVRFLRHTAILVGRKKNQSPRS